MRKKDEIADPHSCLNQAKPYEIVFVLRAHDKAAPRTIMLWVEERILSGLNKYEDAQIQEAIKCASDMYRQREEEGY
jgi:hypothetical protein